MKTRSATEKKDGGIAGITAVADGLYPTTCVPTLLRKHQRCLTYTTTRVRSTKRVLRRDRSKIMKLRMLYILHNKNLGCSCHRQMGHCRTLPQKIVRPQKLNSLSSKLVLWDRPSLKDSWNGGCCLQTEKNKNGYGKKGRRKTSLTLFPRINRLHLPTFMKLKVLQLVPRRERFCMRTGVSYVV